MAFLVKKQLRKKRRIT